MMKKIISPVLFAALAGCSLAPDFMLPKTPETPVFKEAQAFEGTWQEGKPAADQPRGEWWTVFNDDSLNALEKQADDGSLDIQALAERVTQARETAKIAGAALIPTLDGNFSYTREKPNALARGQAAGTQLAPESRFNTGLGLGYEFDLFGSLLNKKKSAEYGVRTAEETLESARLSLHADVAELYFSIRALDMEADLIAETLKLREESLDILKKRLAVGSITELDVASSIVDVENTRTELEKIAQMRKELEHALAVTLGKAPSDFTLEKATLTKDVPVVPAGLPSTLLERRPDIAAAQYRLMSANADIGVAKAAFFPSISLTATGGLESDTLGSLFKWSSRSWSLGPLMTIPIFSGGSATANVKRSESAYTEAVATYRLQVLGAFKDVEDSLSNLKSLYDQRASQKVAEDAAIRAADLADKRYNNGDVGYLEAITAKRAALDVQRGLIRIQGDRLKGTVRLIRALGGGWQAAPAAEDSEKK